ncbi:ensconsin-like isoform X7 [Battus philenor]|uniref:ensconsin-like isoform X7 n=1 Tax=Battus philenor TaxID=42288 RepID=UPI0035D03DE7
MVDDVKDITENAESKVSSEALDRSRLARERREAEQRKRLDELRAHAAAAQAQRERRDEERKRRQAEQRARDDDRRQQAELRAKDNERRLQVEERKRAIWEASVSRREALLQRERERAERLERARAARSTPRPAFAFGSSTPRLLEPVDSAGFFWAARSTNPLDQMNFFESLAASTTNVMFASAPLTRRASALHLDTSDTDNKDEPDRQPTVVWSSVARRRTDLVPTLPAPRAPGRAYSMTRLDKLPRAQPPCSSPSMHHLNRARGGDTGANSIATTPSVSRDATIVAGGDAPRRTPSARKPRPLSLHASPRPVSVQLSYSCAWLAAPATPGDGKPPLHRKPKPSKEYEKRGKSQSPGRALSPTPPRHIDVMEKSTSSSDKRQVNAVEVTQKLEALQIGAEVTQHQILGDKVNESKENVEIKQETKPEQMVVDNREESIEVQKPVEKKEEKREEKKEPSQEKREEKKEPSQEKTEENEMTASMMARRITTEEEAKAALAERRRRAREELERQAELERQRLQREAEEEAERQRQEEERQRREEEEARELAALQRRVEEEKLRKAIEAQQELERQEAEKRARTEAERVARVKEEEDKRRAANEAEKLRREEAEREEKERLARKQRVEAIMARTRLRKQAEEEKKQHEGKAQVTVNQSANDQANNKPAEQTTTHTVEQTTAQVTDSAPLADVQQTIEVTNKSETDERPSQVSENVTAQQTTVESSEHTHVNISVPPPDHVSVSTEQHVPVTEQVSVSTEQSAPAAERPAPADNGNTFSSDLLQLAPNQQEDNPLVDVKAEVQSDASLVATNNGNLTADLLGLSDTNDSMDTSETQTPAAKQNDNAPSLAANNGNQHAGHLSASFIQNERDQLLQQVQGKLPDVSKLLDDDFTTHNGHSATHNHPLTLQNAI